MGCRVILCGASGLVGGHCLPLLLRSPQIQRVITPVRRPLALRDPKLEQLTLDPSQPQHLQQDLVGDALILTLGASLTSDGNYQRVDFQLTAELAALGRQRGINHCLLVSAPYAACHSPSSYLGAKGRAEQALRELGFPLLDIVRPGPLLGRQPPRRLEQVGTPILTLMQRLAGQWAAPLQPIQASDVASALLTLTEDRHRQGIHLFQGKHLAALTRASG